jgi:excisionase family DNA binding protein
MPRDILTPGEVALRTGFSTRTVQRAVRCGELRALRSGSQIRILADWVEDWIKECMARAAYGKPAAPSATRREPTRAKVAAGSRRPQG